MKRALTILGLMLTVWTYGQSVNGVYSGWWGRTNWRHEFKDNKTYKITTEGHFGHTSSKGKYELKQDTIILSKNGLLGEDKRFLIRDSVIIDLTTSYDYMNHKYLGSFIFYNSINHKDRILFLSSASDTQSVLSLKKKLNYPNISSYIYKADTVANGQIKILYGFNQKCAAVLIVSLTYTSEEADMEMIENVDFVFDWITNTLTVINPKISGKTGVINTTWLCRRE